MDDAAFIYNPGRKNIKHLPWIYAYNAGGEPNSMRGRIISEDGVLLGSHICSSEAYMPFDLGVLGGVRASRHQLFKKHYPEGYRIKFIPRERVENNEELKRAFSKYNANQIAEEKKWNLLR